MRNPFRGERKTILIYLAALLPPLFILALIYIYGVNLPYMDEWDDIPIIVKAHDGSLQFANLWAQRNEHRIITVYLVTLLLANLTYYNVVAQMYAGWAIQLLCLLFVWRLLKLTLSRTQPALIPWLTVAASVLLFSPVYAENWIWGLGSVQWFLTNLFAILSVWALVRWPGQWKGVVAASVTAALGMLTMGNGLAIWAVVLIGILAQGYLKKERIRRAHLIFWLAAAAASAAIYSIGYIKPSHHPSILSFLSHPLEFLEYILIYVGSPFGTHPGQYKSCVVSGLAGILLMVAAVYWAWRRLSGVIESITPWVLLALYVLLSATMTAVGRVGFTMLQATESRYRSVALLFWVCLFVVVTVTLVEVYRQGRYRAGLSRWLLVSPLAILLVGGYMWVAVVGFQRLEAHSLKLNGMLPYVYKYDEAPDKIFLSLYPNDNWVRQLSGQMATLGLGPFSGQSGRARTPAAVTSEASAEGFHDENRCDVIRGWAWDKNQPDNAISVDIYEGGTLLATVPANVYRQDLFDAGKGNGIHGFTFAVPPNLKDGRPHSIIVKISGTRKVLFGTPKELKCPQ